MPTNSLRTPAKLSAVVALALALASCGSTPPVVCNALPSSSGTCTCGSGALACPVQPGPEFLYAVGGGQIQAFSVDHHSGALSTVGSVTGPSMSFGLTAVSNQFLYTSDSLAAQLDGFSINQTTGALTALGGSPFSTGTISIPVGLASPPGSNLLYAGDAGRVDAFTVSASGIPTALSSSPFPSGSGLLLAVDPFSNFLYTAIDDPTGTGGVFAYTIDSAGALTAVPGSPFALPGPTGSNRRPFGIVDTGSYVYSALSATNQIAAFSITSSTGALAPVTGSPFSTGATPLALVLASGFLYALNDGGITGYSINSSTGVLTPLSGSPFDIIGGAITTDSFGQHLYVSGPTGIQAFNINSTSGALTTVTGSPFSAGEATAMTVVQIPPP
jgi:6-phosphogluconolactonase (cycloisomerase 2 family)